MSDSTVLAETRDRVRVLTLNRPERRNAFNNEMYWDATHAIRAARAERAVRVIVLTGAGEAFCAGQDLGEMNLEAGTESGFPAFVAELDQCDKPVLTAVNGVGVGIGLTLLLHTDINYIAAGARLRTPFVTLGVVPEAASSYLLPVVVGYQKAAEILFTARWISAEESVELGLTFAVVPRERVLEVACAKAAEIAAHPPGSVRHTKRLMRVWRHQAVAEARAREDEAFQERLRTAENAEAISAFFEKRPPDFDRLPDE